VQGNQGQQLEIEPAHITIFYYLLYLATGIGYWLKESDGRLECVVAYRLINLLSKPSRTAVKQLNKRLFFQSTSFRSKTYNQRNSKIYCGYLVLQLRGYIISIRTLIQILTSPHSLSEKR